MAALVMVHANNMLDASLGVSPFLPTSPPIHCRLMTANGTPTQAGTEVPATGGYTPGPDAPVADFAPASASMSQNTNQIKIINMPACTVVGVELWDSTFPLGVRKWYGALATPKQLNAGDTFTINVGALTALLS